MTNALHISARVKAPLALVWDAFTQPAHIVNWNFASPDWHCPSAENDLRPGGKFSSRMAAKDGSFAFDFEGVYEEVVPHSHYSYVLGDGRKVKVAFSEHNGETQIDSHFEPENQHDPEFQKAGWQAILNNFAAYAENLKA